MKDSLTLDQFQRALQKIGLVIGTTDELQKIFAHYAVNNDGRLNYREVARCLSEVEVEHDDDTVSQTTAAVSMAHSTQQRKQELERAMQLFRDKVKSRGARGIVGLQRIFKIMDDDRSRSLSRNEFQKACRDFKVGIADEFIDQVFDAFDVNRDGTLSIDEFLKTLRGDLNDTRKAIITKVF